MENTAKSKEKLIAYLEFVRDSEADKPIEEMDVELVDACVELLLELQDESIAIDSEEIKEKVRNMPFKENSGTAKPSEKRRKKKVNKRKLFLLAACMTVLAAIIGAVHSSSDWDILDPVKEKYGSVANLPLNEEVQIGNNTYERVDPGRNYESLEDAMKKETFSILVPTVVGDEPIKIKQVKFHEYHGVEEIDLILENRNLYFTIEQETGIPEYVIEQYKEVTINGIKCHMLETQEQYCVQTVFLYDGDVYFISYTDKEAVEELIKSMEVIGNEN